MSVAFRVNQRQLEDPRLCRQLAELGHAEAQFRHALRLDFGRQGIPQNFPEAVSWYRKAVEKDHAEAKVWCWILRIKSTWNHVQFVLNFITAILDSA